MNKICKKHGLVEFKPRSGKTKFRCSKCAIEAVNRRRNKLKIMSIEYKGNCCSICKYDKCIAALEFHHLDPSKKDFQIGSANKSWSTIKLELDKCILVCANCHRELHNI